MKESDMADRLHHSYSMFQEVVWATVEDSVPQAAIVGGSTDWEEISVAMIGSERFMTEGYFNVPLWRQAIHQTFEGTIAKFACFAMPIDVIEADDIDSPIEDRVILVGGVDCWGYDLAILKLDENENPVEWQMVPQLSEPYQLFLQPLRRCVAHRG